MLAKNQINKNKMDNKAKSDNKNIDFMSFIQNDINGHIEMGVARSAGREGARTTRE